MKSSSHLADFDVPSRRDGWLTDEWPMCAASTVLRWVFPAILHKPLQPENARIAFSACIAEGRRVITTGGHTVIHAQLQPARDDLRLTHPEKRGMNLELLFALDRRLGRQVRHILESLNELRTAIRISAVINCIHAQEDVTCTSHLRQP